MLFRGAFLLGLSLVAFSAAAQAQQAIPEFSFSPVSTARPPCRLMAPSADLSLDNGSVGWFNDFINAERCTEAFDEASWEPVPVKPEYARLTQFIANDYLIRFSKPGGFKNRRQDISMLSWVLGLNLDLRNPDRVAAVLANVLKTAPSVYVNMLKKYPRLRKLDSARFLITDAAALCWTSDEEAIISKAVTAYLGSLQKKFKKGAKLKDWEVLAPLAPVLRKYSLSNRAAATKAAAEIMKSIEKKEKKGSPAYQEATQRVQSWFDLDIRSKDCWDYNC